MPLSHWSLCLCLAVLIAAALLLSSTTRRRNDELEPITKGGDEVYCVNVKGGSIWFYTPPEPGSFGTALRSAFSC